MLQRWRVHNLGPRRLAGLGLVAKREELRNGANKVGKRARGTYVRERSNRVSGGVGGVLRSVMRWCARSAGQLVIRATVSDQPTDRPTDRPTWCMDTKTIDTPRKKLTVSACPNSTNDSSAVQMVAMVLEYFLRMVSAVGGYIHDYLRSKGAAGGRAWNTVTNMMMLQVRAALAAQQVCRSAARQRQLDPSRSSRRDRRERHSGQAHLYTDMGMATDMRMLAFEERTRELVEEAGQHALRRVVCDEQVGDERQACGAEGLK